MKKVAVYIRVSTLKKEQEKSLEHQKTFFNNYIQKNNLELYDLYVDKETATKSNTSRKDYSRMLQDAKLNKFDIILSKDISRLARNGKVAYELRDLAINKRIDIITFDSGINTVTGDTKNFGLFAWMSEQESERISERTKYSLRVRASKGLYKGSTPPYGYNCKDGKLFINNDTTPTIVKRIFNEYISGKGFDAIARGLFDDNIPTPSGNSCKWYGSTIRVILTNPHYTGDLVLCRTTTASVISSKRKNLDSSQFIITQNSHDAIISKEDFKLVQNLIEQRKRKRPSAQLHLFSNLLFCDDCGKGMHFKKNSKGYICGSYDKFGKKACKRHIIREDDLYNMILNDINILINKINNKSLLVSIENKFKLTLNKYKSQLSNINKDIENLTLQKNKALDKLINDIISKADYDYYVKKINIDISTLYDEKNKLKHLIDNCNSSQLSSDLNYLKKLTSNITELNSNLLNRLIEKIHIKEDGSLRIYYKFSWATDYLN